MRINAINTSCYTASNAQLDRKPRQIAPSFTGEDEVIISKNRAGAATGPNATEKYKLKIEECLSKINALPENESITTKSIINASAKTALRLMVLDNMSDDGPTLDAEQIKFYAEAYKGALKALPPMIPFNPEVKTALFEAIDLMVQIAEDVAPAQDTEEKTLEEIMAMREVTRTMEDIDEMKNYGAAMAELFSNSDAK